VAKPPTKPLPKYKIQSAIASPGKESKAVKNLIAILFILQQYIIINYFGFSNLPPYPIPYDLAG